MKYIRAYVLDVTDKKNLGCDLKEVPLTLVLGKQQIDMSVHHLSKHLSEPKMINLISLELIIIQDFKRHANSVTRPNT